MSAAYLEFLTENAQRRYPLVEDASNLDLTDTFALPDNTVLDVRGFHRVRPELQPRLAAICGPTAPLNADYPADPTSNSIFFECGTIAAPIRFAVRVPLSNGVWPFVANLSIDDPLYAGVKLAVLQATIGEGVLSVGASDRWLFGDRLRLEPASVAQLYRQQIDCLRIIHDDGPDEYVGGDVKIESGYNFDLTQFQNTISLEPSVGGGALGRFVGSLVGAELSRCAGALLTINGISPNAKMSFTIKGGTGIDIKEIPEEHKIQIQISSGNLQRPVCN